MNCLVTGATGFLGRHLTKILHARDFKRVTGYTGLMQVTISNTKTNSLDRVENLTHLKKKFNYIFHLAAVTKAGDYCLTHQGDQWISNQKNQHQHPRLLEKLPASSENDLHGDKLLLFT